MPAPFFDRTEAGRELAGALSQYAWCPDVMVLGLPRGGVPVAAEVARVLGAPLDVIVVRKLGVPGREELAMGAIASGGVQVLNDLVISGFAIDPATVEQVIEMEARELMRRESLYRGDRPYPSLRDRCVILIDDGLATGSTMHAAVDAVREHQAKTIIVAAPVASPSASKSLSEVADQVVCLAMPTSFRCVGEWYECFDQTTDQEVREKLGADERSPASG